MTWRTLIFMGFSRREIIGSGLWVRVYHWLRTSGTLLGLLLGWLLVAVINVQSFGWTLVWNLIWRFSLVVDLFL